MYKIVVLLALVVAVSCMPQYSHQEHHEEAQKGGHKYHHEEHYPSEPIKYKFKYEVHDPHTHDIHSQEEEGDGHYVKGVYKLHEPYGGERVVEYADEGHGFVAKVHTSKITHPEHHGHKHEYH